MNEIFFLGLVKILLTELTVPELLKVLQRIESRGALETAHRALGDCGEILRYAIATGRAEHDISGDLRGALPPSRGKHLAAVTDPEQVAEMLNAMDGYKGTLMVRCALRLAPLVFVRPGELRKAEWKDIDLDKAEWRFTVTKTGTQHIVPLIKASRGYFAGAIPINRERTLCFPEYTYQRTTNERQHYPRSNAKHGYRQRRNEWPWFQGNGKNHTG